MEQTEQKPKPTIPMTSYKAEMAKRALQGANDETMKAVLARQTQIIRRTEAMQFTCAVLSAFDMESGATDQELADLAVSIGIMTQEAFEKAWKTKTDQEAQN